MSREAFVELLRAEGVEVSARTLGDIERGRVRMTALEIVETVERIERCESDPRGSALARMRRMVEERGRKRAA